MSRTIVNLSMIALSLALGLLLLELGLRLLAPTSSTYRIWPPYLAQTFHPDEDRFPGVRGPSRFRVNSRGLRGDELEPGHALRIIAVGGSTTECLILDQQEAWPQRLQALLDGDGRLGRVWVGNAGRSGHGTREHRYQVRRLLDEYPELDALILLAGVNDLGLRLKQDEDYDADFTTREDAEETLLRRAFSQLPLRYRDDLPWYKRSELYGRLRTLKDLARARFATPAQVQDPEFTVYDRWRERRRDARRVIEELPDLDAALAEYRANLEHIVDLARARGVRLLLVTQPSLWRADLGAAERALLWWGGIGDYRGAAAPRDYYSVAALAAGMARYNREMLSVCAARGVECIDLAAALPRDTSVFVDGVHFNENGARLVAERIARVFLD